MSMLRVKATASKVEAILGYTFINKLLCAEAVQMAGPRATVNVEDGDSFASKFRQVDNNKRLAVLGDAVLAKLLCEEWYQTTDANGHRLTLGDWTLIRNATLTNSALAERGYQLHLHKCIFVNPGTLSISTAMVAMTVEAIFGAIHQDGGDEAARLVMRDLGFFSHALLAVKF